MNILLANDDGYQAPGILALRDALQKEHTVYMVAPDGERSAQSHCLTVTEPIRLTQLDDFAYRVSGGPADCVKLALGYIMPERNIQIDVVVSGINNGANIGSDVIYSGTLGAAREGTLNRVPSIAFSMGGDYFAEKPYHSYGAFILSLLRNLFEKPVSDNLLLNVNLPFSTVDKVKGVKITKLAGLQSQRTVVQPEKKANGEEVYWLQYQRFEVADESTDVNAIANNYISLTPLKLDTTHTEQLEKYTSLSEMVIPTS